MRRESLEDILKASIFVGRVDSVHILGDIVDGQVHEGGDFDLRGIHFDEAGIGLSRNTDQLLKPCHNI